MLLLMGSYYGNLMSFVYCSLMIPTDAKADLSEAVGVQCLHPDR